jgi:prenyltransferase beta subunit
MLERLSFKDFYHNQTALLSLATVFDPFWILVLDALHSYFGVCGLALMDEPGLLPVFAPLNISKRAVDHLHQLHSLHT